VRFEARSQRLNVYATQRGLTLDIRGKGDRGLALMLDAVRPAGAATPTVERRTQARFNYLTGGSTQAAGVPGYEQLRYRDLWPGIDMIVRGSGAALKYEFLVRPGADPSRIQLAYRGARGLSVAAGGALAVNTAIGTLRDAAPRSWQSGPSGRHAVPSSYAVGAGNRYGFELGAYDRTRPLVIDPTLAYATLLGGSLQEWGNGQASDIAADSQGSAYITGFTGSSDFPTTPGAYDTTFGGARDVFVTKLSADGSSLAYSTYLGGSSYDEGRGIAVDSSGEAYVGGHTESADFPTTPGAFDRTYGAGGVGDGFVAKLTPSGGLDWSTFLGGGTDAGDGFGTPPEGVTAIALDDQGDVFATGGARSTDFPTTPGAYDTTLGASGDVFAAELGPTGSNLVYGTFVGGGFTGQSGEIEGGYGISLDRTGAIYVSGWAISTSYPVTPGVWDPSYEGCNGSLCPTDGVATKIAPGGDTLAYSTYLPTPGLAIEVDSSGRGYMPANCTVLRLNESATSALEWTGLSACVYDVGLDERDVAYASGAYAGPSANGTFTDAFISQLDPDGTGELNRQTIGGGPTHDDYDFASDIAVTRQAIYIGGGTYSTDFHTTSGAYDTTFNGNSDAFVAKYSFPEPYARPKAATPIYAPLVPAFEPCAAPNRVHASPLGFGSCNPPQQRSNAVTIGTPDANGNPAKSLGHVRLTWTGELPINPNNGNQADIVIDISTSDVRNSSGLSDYTGELRAQLALRITDKNNVPTSNATGDTTFGVTIPCTATPDTTIGSTCAISTTANSVIPGSVLEQQRAIWELGPIDVYDGGPDGDGDTPAGNQLFERQGLSIP
jgi:hypothetical protein